MNADPLPMKKVFGGFGNVQYILPHFQREYAWDKEHWQTLFDDILEIYDSNPESNPEHFMGALVVIQDGDSPGAMSQFTLVDGQQRLTTISILLCALRESVEVQSSLRPAIDRLLINPDEEGELHFKIKPTLKYSDREAYYAIIADSGSLRSFESGVVPAWKYFRKRLSDVESPLDYRRFFDCVVNCMQVVFIKLNRSEQAHRIFESLNAKGKSLTQADLVRNYIAMTLPPERQESAFYEYWSEIDDMLQERRRVSRMGELTAFLRHYLARINGVLPKTAEVYARFRDHMERINKSPDQFIEELRRLHQFAGFYDKLLRPAKEPNPLIRVGLERLNVFVESVCYPFLLHMYFLYADNAIAERDFAEALSLIENYGVRRFLAGERTNSLNNIFAALPRELGNPDHLIESLTSLLREKGYPSNDRVRQNLRLRFRYATRSRERLILILLTIDRHLARDTGGYPVLDDDPTIEHIMPQSINDDWKAQIGENWEEVYEEHLNVLGNLTLVTQDWNTELSNGAFAAKKAKLSNHALHINSGYFSRDICRWNKQAIRLRTEWLSDQSLEVWYPLGGFPQPRNIANSTPNLLTIVGKSYKVDSWRDVLIQTVEALAPRFLDFEGVARRFNRNISRTTTGFLKYYQLENGYYLKTNENANTIYSFCMRYVRAAGLDGQDWQVYYE